MASSSRFIIKGGKPLCGTVDVRGSKNAALPIVAATILVKEQCIIDNVPAVSDVLVMLDALQKMGADVRWLGRRKVAILNKKINPHKIDKEIVERMRASILLVGPLVARFGEVSNMRYPGGCSIGARSIETHLTGFEDLGAKVVRGKKTFSVLAQDLPAQNSRIILTEFSVTATENLMMFLSGIPRKNNIEIAASEPHVINLAKFLIKMGAKIRGAGTSTISVRGNARLHGITHKITPDYIEAGTFLLIALATGGEVTLKNAPISHLALFIKKLMDARVDIACNSREKTITIKGLQNGRNAEGNKVILNRMQTMPYPGMPTDLQSCFGVLATQTFGKTLIHEPLYEKRLECLKELVKMGGKVNILDPHRAIIDGPTELHGAEVYGRDLRSAAALVIAGLVARGTTVVYGAEHAERGYEDFTGRLCALGAEIKKA